METPKSIGQVLESTIESENKKKLIAAAVMEQWKLYVPTDIQERIQKKYYYNGKIFVKTSCAACRSELFYIKYELIKNIKDALGTVDIHDIIFLY